jgi:hypothetical protein
MAARQLVADALAISKGDRKTGGTKKNDFNEPWKSLVKIQTD